VIEFRYHIVSLIAVFLALAVGIVLGAGPLKEAIGSQLTGQVEQLRQEKAALRTELDTANHGIDDRDAFINGAAPSLLGGLLNGRRVAIITLGQPSDTVVGHVRDRLVQAGATVTGEVDVEKPWTDPARRAFRESLSGSLLSYLQPRPADDAGLDGVLGEALAQGLTRPAAGSKDALADSAGLQLDLLRESKLITLSKAVTIPADDIVLVVGPTPAFVAGQADQRTAEHATLDALIEACFRRSFSLVVAAGAPDQHSLVQAIRADLNLERTIATVESIETEASAVSVTLALANRVTGVVGHYGFDSNDTAVVPPRVALPPIVRTAGAAPTTRAPASTPTQGSG